VLHEDNNRVSTLRHWAPQDHADVAKEAYFVATGPYHTVKLPDKVVSHRKSRPPLSRLGQAETDPEARAGYGTAASKERASSPGSLRMGNRYTQLGQVP